MRTLSTLKVFACTTFLLALSISAQAQATRTWVSGVGDDVNPCSRTAPCKTFAGAISKTFTHGEIDALDSGGFGTITITKSITLDGGAALASILSSGVNGVNINIASNANDPNRRVTLRRLSINGTGASGSVGTSTGLKGVNVNSNGAAQVYIENTYIQNFNTAGVDINPTVSISPTRVGIKDTTITNTVIGVQGTAPSGQFANGVLDNVRIEGMTNGIILKDRFSLGIRDTVIQNCSNAGVNVQATAASLTSLENAYIFSCNVGVNAGPAGTTVDFSNTSIVGNSTGVATGGATLTSHGNNRFLGNSSNGTLPGIVGPQ